MTKIILVPSLALLMNVACSAASAQGWEVGWMAAATRNQLASQDNAGGPVSDPAWLNFMLVSPRERDNRYVAQLYSTRFYTSASTRDVGATVNRSGVNLSYQWLLRLTRDWKPWVGVGAGYARETHNTRYTLRSDGYLGQTFPDLAPSGLVVLANASTEWSVADQVSVGLHLQLELPLAHTTTVTGVGVYLLYEMK